MHRSSFHRLPWPRPRRLYVCAVLLLGVLLSSHPLTSALTARVPSTADRNEQVDVELPHHWATFGPHTPDTSALLFPLASLAAALALPDLDELCSLPPALLSNVSTLALLSGRALLLRRSLDSDPNRCDFATKVNNSQALGAAACIVANVRQAEDPRHQYNSALITMTVNEADKGRYEWRVPALFIGADSAEQLLELWDEADGSVEVWLGDESASASVHAGMKRLSVMLPFAAAFASAMLYWQAMVAHWAIERRLTAEEEARFRELEERDSGTPPLQPPAAIPDPTVNMNGAAREVEAGSGYVRGNGSDEYTAVAVNEDESKEAEADGQAAASEDEWEGDEPLRALGDDEGMDALFDPPSRSIGEWLEEWTERALSALAKPRAIMAFNMLVYLLYVSAALCMLWVWPDEQCETDLQGLAALFFCRAVIGARICYWQTHSDTPLPACGEVFVKNWCDWFLLTGGLTGSIQVWHAGQCNVLAPHVLLGCQLLVLLIYTAWIARIMLWLYIGFTKLHIHLVAEEAAQQAAQSGAAPSSAAPEALDGTPTFAPPLTASSPHLLTLARGVLDIVNGGFWWAGALDRVRPATPLDLRSLPTIRYRRGMPLSGGGDDEQPQCSICLSEFEPGESLRLLYCEHVFHVGCADAWLLRNATCPTCRASVDKEKGEEQVRQRRAKRARRKHRRQRRRERQERSSVELHDFDRARLSSATSTPPIAADGMV